MSAGDFRLLVIDDEDSVRQSIVAYLESCGYQVFQACNGEQGIAKYHQLHPDVVLCDLKMHAVDGMSVLRAIASADDPSPVIVISAVGIMSDVVEALRYGASDYLIKPIVDLEVLAHSVERCLEYARLRRQNSEYRRQLEMANLELKNNLAVLEQDHTAGRQVQFKMLPPNPKVLKGIEFTHAIIPSLYLSGDFVDYFLVGRNKVVFFLADVSGHGASSAFVTVLLKNLFARKRSDYVHRKDTTILSPVAMLAKANSELLDTAIGKHVTMCVGVLNVMENSLLMSIAGHLPLPVLYSNGKAIFLEGKGMPVGLFEHAEFNENRIELPDSFVLSMFSDGILEVMPADGVLAQEQQLLAYLQNQPGSIAALSADMALDQVQEAPDDIAILRIARGDFAAQAG
jgi:serine phosphatase RsbU (regulator of sigma subunit)